MKQITREDWEEKFRFISPEDMDIDFDDVVTFYDNGAVSNSEGDFVVKCDQVEPR